MPEQTLSRRLAQHYGLPPQSAQFFALLILEECVNPATVAEHMGYVNIHNVAHRLRCNMEKHELNVQIRSQRLIGYWLDHGVREKLAKQHGAQLNGWRYEHH